VNNPAFIGLPAWDIDPAMTVPRPFLCAELVAFPDAYVSNIRVPGAPGACVIVESFGTTLYNPSGILSKPDPNVPFPYGWDVIPA